MALFSSSWRFPVPFSTKFICTTLESSNSSLPVGFREWTDDAPLRFIETSDVEEADFRIFFAGGAHGDPSDFDGPGGVLAHAFYPR